MSSKRQLKYAGLIQKEMSDLFGRAGGHWLANAFITVTQVDMTPDLSMAKIYISVMMVDDKAQFMSTLKSKKSELRKGLGLKIGKQVRIVPDIDFFLDPTQEQAQKMDDLIAGLDIPPYREEEENND